MEPSLTSQLLQLIKSKTITDDDRQRAAVHVLDWLSCCSAAKNKEVAQNFEKYLASHHIDTASNVAVVFGKPCYWQDALLINGALGNILEMDDIHRSSILHPGPVVIPAALAVAQLKNCTMAAFLDAVILGYDITIRLGEAIGRSHYVFFHNTATCAGFGATLAASHLLALSEEQTLWALGNLGSRTGGLWQMRHETVMTKQWHNADAARNGVMTALLAQAGITGPMHILEGPQGVFNAFSQDANPTTFLQNSSHWRIYDCSFKPWPACRHAHPALDVVMSTMREHNFLIADERSLSEIANITIHTYQDAITFCDRQAPTTETQAKFSIQHAVSAYLKWGEPTLAHYCVEKIAELAPLREKVSVEMEPEFESRYPSHYGASCSIKLASGQVFRGAQRDTLGDPEKPLSVKHLKSKAEMLLLEGKVDRATIEALLSLEWAQQGDLSRLNSLIISN